MLYKLRNWMTFYSIVFHNNDNIKSSTCIFILSQCQLFIEIIEHPVSAFLITNYISTSSGSLY